MTAIDRFTARNEVSAIDLLYGIERKLGTVSETGLSAIKAIIDGASVRMEIVESFLADDKHREWHIIETPEVTDDDS